MGISPGRKYKFDILEPEKQEEILEKAEKTSTLAASKEYFEEVNMPQGSLKMLLDRRLNKKKKLENYKLKIDKKRRDIRTDGELTLEETELLRRFKEGKVGYDEVQRELAYRVFEKMLTNPDSIKIRDWLQSELIKLKKDETTRQKDALEKFIISLFGGFIPSIKCPHCHMSTVIPVSQIGEVLDGTESSEDK